MGWINKVVKVQDEKDVIKNQCLLGELTFAFHIKNVSQRQCYVPFFSQTACLGKTRWRLSFTPVKDHRFAVHAIYVAGPLPVQLDLSILLQAPISRHTVQGNFYLNQWSFFCFLVFLFFIPFPCTTRFPSHRYASGTNNFASLQFLEKANLYGNPSPPPSL